MGILFCYPGVWRGVGRAEMTGTIKLAVSKTVRTFTMSGLAHTNYKTFYPPHSMTGWETVRLFPAALTVSS